MSIDLADADLRSRAAGQPWRDPEAYWGELNETTRECPAPVVALHLSALAYNAHELLRRAGGLPIRLASKSLRVRGVLDAVLALPGFRGVLAYTLAEALWLSDRVDDVVVAYPSVDRAAYRTLGANAEAAERVTVMIDGIEQLDLIDSVVSPRSRAPIRVCLDFDASWRSKIFGHVGVLRSPVHDPGTLRQLAQTVLRRPGFQLVGVMSYEAQIAGVGDSPRGRPIMGNFLRAMQRSSARELAERRAEAITLVREVVELEFVNGGGTGSLERTVAEPMITEVAAGSGLFGPHVFDHYRAFTPAPAAAFALDVVRKATPTSATLLGGGWIASGAPGIDRMPAPVWPAGLRTTAREGSGEVQTPVIGDAAKSLHVGDRVWLRHTKSGEIMEHRNSVLLVDQGRARDELVTYRGEGKSFL